MAWEHDQPPLEYLKRRIVYYKKKRGRYKKLIGNRFFIMNYPTEIERRKVIDILTDKCNNRIKEFTDAVSTLSVKKLEKMRTK